MKIMNYKKEKFVRFDEWIPQERVAREFPWKDGIQPSKFKAAISSILGGLWKGLKSLRACSPKHIFSHASTGKKILDPQGSFLQRWNKIFLLSCVIAVSLDPLFFYIPVINNQRTCLGLDKKLEITASVLRSFTDIFYVLHIILQFRTGFIAPSSRVFGRGILVEDTWAIAKRYLLSYFWIDILAVLPLPQAVIAIIPKLGGSRALKTKKLLKFIVLFQYAPRVLRIIPLYQEITRSSGILTETAWAGAAFNLFLYMLASHAFGAFWYLFSIERETTCWRKACEKYPTLCAPSALYCDEPRGNNTFLSTFCPITTDNTTYFDFGIFLKALESEVVATTYFPKKFFFCFWWGLQNLSSLGQNLQTSTYLWENCFAILVAIAGLVLFALLIGNMQTLLQSTTTRLEEMRVKKRDAEQWMSHRLLPENLRERIRRYEQYKWQETRGVDEESLIYSLPKDLRRDIKRHLCLDLLMRVPMFEKMDGQLLDAMCDRLKPILYTEESVIIREGDPVDEMLFIMRGKLSTTTTNGGRTGFLNTAELKAGDFCGEELLTWALDPNSTSNLHSSTRTVRTVTEVEGFALAADDLKFVASQFRKLHSKQLRHTFRFYSQQWRTWAACFIQVAWRRYCRKKMEDLLREEEDRLQSALARQAGTSSPSFTATIYASRFAANILRSLRRNKMHKPRLPERLPPLLLQKPAEPDFSVEDD
ncbi:Cyclic nucleotide-gated ion channel 1 [Dionaea muscipula]